MVNRLAIVDLGALIMDMLEPTPMRCIATQENVLEMQLPDGRNAQLVVKLTTDSDDMGEVIKPAPVIYVGDLDRSINFLRVQKKRTHETLDILNQKLQLAEGSPEWEELFESVMRLKSAVYDFELAQKHLLKLTAKEEEVSNG